MKHSFLVGIALQAHCDSELAEQETDHFKKVATTLGFEPGDAEGILRACRSPGEEMVLDIRDRLIQTKYKYYFIIDLHIMAFQDDVVRGVETQVIEQFCRLLEIDDDEREFLTSLAHAVVTEDPEKKQWWLDSFLSKASQNPFLSADEFSHYTSTPK